MCKEIKSCASKSQDNRFRGSSARIYGDSPAQATSVGKRKKEHWHHRKAAASFTPALVQRASKSLGSLLQLAPQRVHLLGNFFQLVLRKRSCFHKFVSLAISLAHRCSDFHRNLRQLAFLGHRAPSIPTKAILYTPRNSRQRISTLARSEE